MDDGRALTTLPPRFSAWFEGRGWVARSHQLTMVEKARTGRHALLIAPTGGGKTLAGFMPLAIIVDAVRMPSRCAARMPRFTSGVNPKSSALTISRLREIKRF